MRSAGGLVACRTDAHKPLAQERRQRRAQRQVIELGRWNKARLQQRRVADRYLAA